jgi:hypothetical protein|tara:strand:+ start:160 stop:375 length:216 start_codon:yes stop_codon:yes gene_type:complete
MHIVAASSFLHLLFPRFPLHVLKPFVSILRPKEGGNGPICLLFHSIFPLVSLKYNSKKALADKKNEPFKEA